MVIEEAQILPTPREGDIGLGVDAAGNNGCALKDWAFSNGDCISQCRVMHFKCKSNTWEGFRKKKMIFFAEGGTHFL